MIRNLKKSSQKSYAVVLNNYTQIQQTSIDELIQEADDEEEQGIRISKRKIKTRLINYKMKLQEQKLSDRTINDRITKIRTFYAQFDITPPKITRNKVKVIETYQHIIKPKQTRKSLPFIADCPRRTSGRENPCPSKTRRPCCCNMPRNIGSPIRYSLWMTATAEPVMSDPVSRKCWMKSNPEMWLFV